jgi:hypothetical protein
VALGDVLLVPAQRPRLAVGLREGHHGGVDDNEVVGAEVVGEPLGRDERRGQGNRGHAVKLCAIGLSPQSR